MSKEKEPLGIRITEFSKKVDLIQIGVGGLIYFVNSVLGFGIVAISSGIYILAAEYQKQRRGKQQIATARI